MFNAKFARKIAWQNNENVGLPFFYEEKSFRLKPIERWDKRMGYTNHARKHHAIRRSENGIYREYQRSCGHTFDTMGYVY